MGVNNQALTLRAKASKTLAIATNNSLALMALTFHSHMRHNPMHNSLMRNSHTHNNLTHNSQFSKRNSLKNRSQSQYRPLTCLFIPLVALQARKTDRVEYPVMLVMQRKLQEGSSTGETTSPIDMEEP